MIEYGIVFDVDPESKHKCQNCGKILLGKELGEILDFSQRVSPGEQCPSGECPHCGALAHPIPARMKRR